MPFRVLYRPRRQYANINFGLLYNFYAAADERKITNSDDWVVPAMSDILTLLNYAGSTAQERSNKLRETGTPYWADPNTGATNEFSFNSRGVGSRWDSPTNFAERLIYHRICITDAYSADYTYIFSINRNEATCNTAYGFKKTNGRSIRLLYTGAGTPTSYTGNDGKIYRVIKIGSQYWLVDNLAETLYRNGDPIPEVRDNAQWAALTIGALCAYDNNWYNVGNFNNLQFNFSANYGILYNWFAANDSRKITSSDEWTVPTAAEWNLLCTNIGGYSVAGGKLKENGLTWWNTPNTGATNEKGMNIRGSGYRDYVTGLFNHIKNYFWAWTLTPWTEGSARNIIAASNSAGSSAGSGSNYKYGMAIRLKKATTTLTAGQTGTYTGNNGLIYPTIVIDNGAGGNVQEWLACNLAETKFRNAETIPQIQDNSAWAALTTAAYSMFDNNPDNSGTITPAQTTPAITETNLINAGLSSSDIDTRLIFLASIGTTAQVINIQGNNVRTSASDAAVALLTTDLDNNLIED